MKKITEVTDLQSKHVLLRSSLNIPLKDGEVRSMFRIERALPTMRYLHEHGAKTIVVGHIGREPEETLKPIFNELEKYLPIQWGGVLGSDEFNERKELMQSGDLLLVENMRQNSGEKENSAEFVELLASQAELFVNDAFAAVHREHASTYGVAQKLPAYAGLTLLEEVSELSKVTQPESPSLFLLGGAKFETKMPLIEKYLELYDQVFIGGALANDVLKAKGIEIGQSMVSNVSLVDAPFLNHEKLLLPKDVIIEGGAVKPVDKVLPEERIMDCGPETVAMLSSLIEKSKTVLWNGPFGAYEDGYTTGTEDTAKLLAEAEAFSVVGGGDTVAAIEKLDLNKELGFVSIGGGSMLAFLEKGTTEVLDLL